MDFNFTIRGKEKYYGIFNYSNPDQRSNVKPGAERARASLDSSFYKRETKFKIFSVNTYKITGIQV